MASKSHNVQALGESLTCNYRLACELYNTFPVAYNTHSLSHGSLCVDLSTTDHNQMEAICHILQNKTTPLFLQMSITSSKEVSARIIQQAIRGISLCLAQSQNLTTLDLNNIPLFGKNLELLCQGLSKSRNVKALNISSCILRNAGVESICQNIKNIPSVSVLSLVDCCISDKGAQVIAGLLKHQGLNRDSAMWQDTLRLRHPHLDGMRGLRRITLNNNPKFGDTGAKALAEVLSEDLWIKAVDLQHCGISSEGSSVLMEMLKSNHTIEVLDLRRNPFVSKDVVDDIVELLHGREDQYNVNQYEWLVSNPSQNTSRKIEVKRNSTRNTSPVKKVVEKPNSSFQSQTPSRRAPSIPDKTGIPWRVEHRIYERREGLKPGSGFVDAFEGGTKSSPILDNTSDACTENVSKHLRKLKKVLRHYKHMYRKEKRARIRADQKLSTLRTKMAEGHVIDEKTISHIEICFQKFQMFLMKLKSAGFQWHEGLWDSLCGDLGLTSDQQPNMLLPSQGKLQYNQSIKHPNVITPLDHLVINSRESEDLSQLQGNEEFSSKPNDYLVEQNQRVSEIYNETTPLMEEEHVMGNSLQSSVEMEQNKKYEGDQINERVIDKLHKDIDISRNLLMSTVSVNRGEMSGDCMNDTVTIPDKVILESNIQMSPKNNSCNVNTEDDEEHENQDEHCKIVNSSRIEVFQQNENKSPPKVSEISRNKSQIQILISNSKEMDVIQNEIKQTADDENTKKFDDTSKLEHNSKFESIQFSSHLSIADHVKDLDLEWQNSSNNSSNTISQLEAQKEKAALIHNSENEKRQILGSTNEIIESVKISQTSPTANEKMDSEEVKDADLFSHRSETDDEKLKIKKSHTRRAPRSGSISSVSITEHLNQSHSSWTISGKSTKPHRTKSGDVKILADKPRKNRNITGVLDLKEISTDVNVSKINNQMDYDSDFEVSDVEGLSISASSLTSTTISDNLVTPGEEEF